MFDNEYHISRLIAGYLREELSTEEKTELDSWLNASATNRDLLNQLSSDQEFFNDINTFRSSSSNTLWQKTMQKIEGQKSTDVPFIKSTSLFKKYRYIAVAASVILVLGIAVYLKSEHTDKLTAHLSAANNISPGKNTATLTLANGKKIILSDAQNGEIAQQTGVSINKTADGKLIYKISEVKSTGKVNYNTLTTARGEQYQVILPDGTRVWLNAASSLQFPETFSSLKERRVKLIGEAYFEVVKNKTLPFKVESENQTVEVLGTSFNINSYKDESSVKTTLLEGLVKINETTFLKPDQQAIVTGKNIDVIPVMAEAFIDWKEGVFAFKTEELPSIMRKVSRWYNVEVVYRRPVTDHYTYTGTISRSARINNVLYVLEEIVGLKFKIEGKKIIVAN